MNRADVSTGVVERVELSPQCAHPAFGQTPYPQASQDEVPCLSKKDLAMGDCTKNLQIATR